MYTFTEACELIYPGYKMDAASLIVPDTAKTVNYEKLKEILLSKDEQLLKENEWIFDGDHRYLDGTSTTKGKVTYITFPRVGNTMLRKYLE